MAADVPGAVAATIAALVPGLRPSDARVMSLVLDDPAFVQTATTEELARRADVSPATVVRAARAAGFAGFSDLKRALLREGARLPGEPSRRRLTGRSPAAEICRVVLASHAASLRAAPATLDATAVEQAISVLARARTILVFGVGTSAAPAADAAYRWTAIGRHAHAPPDPRTAELQARLLARGDALVAVSHSGSSVETLAVADAAAAAGARVIAVSSFESSALAERADVLLVAGGPDLGLHMATSSSRLAHLAVVDILHAGLSLADLPRSRRALRHAAEITAARATGAPTLS